MLAGSVALGFRLMTWCSPRRSKRSRRRDRLLHLHALPSARRCFRTRRTQRRRRHGDAIWRRRRGIVHNLGTANLARGDGMLFGQDQLDIAPTRRRVVGCGHEGVPLNSVAATVTPNAERILFARVGDVYIRLVSFSVLADAGLSLTGEAALQAAEHLSRLRQLRRRPRSCPCPRSAYPTRPTKDPSTTPERLL